MKRLIFLAEMHQIPKLMRFAGNGDIAVSLKQEVSDVLRARKIKFRSLDDYPKPSEDDALKWMKEWPLKRLDGKTFIDYFVHERLSLWWLMENWLYYSSAYFDPVRDVLLSLQTIETILDKEKPDEIAFADDGKINSEILKLFTGYKMKAIPMGLFRALYNLKRRARVFLIGGFIDLGFFLRRFLWSIMKPFRRDGKGKILLISTYAWGLAKSKSGPYTRYDPFIDPIISELRTDVMSVNIPVGRLLGLKQMIDNLNHPGYRILENYYSKGAKNKYKAAVKSISGAWAWLKADKNFSSSFEYRSKNIWPLVEKQFSAYFSSRLEGHIRDAELIREMLKAERPEIVVYPGETSEFGRSLFHLCNVNKIPSVGIQHGIFNKYLACTHLKGESRVGAAGPHNCPIPTKTLVYGPKYKRMLESGNYPKGSVAVTGSQRFDRIVSGRNIFDKNETCKKFGLDSKKSIVALVTSPIPQGDTEVMTGAIIESAKKMNAQLIIKLHPSESFSVYRSIVSRSGGTAIVRDVDLYEVLNACDIAITHLSTAAIEAMLFDKPVIMLNLTGKPDRVDYAKSGAAFGVYRKKELLPAMRKLLRNERFYAGRKKLIRAFVFDNAFRADGASAKRMAEIINGLRNKYDGQHRS